jgi:EAL domain-containing protein (putative c-di-GMP-specific phosphodiesterase class I)/CheY-like chemotaxis protein
MEFYVTDGEPMMASARPKARVLAVDDEPLNLQLLERTLRRDYDVLSACTPDDALALLKGNEDIAIIISDYLMPGMNGAELLAQSLNSHPNARRVILTGYADVENIVNAVNNGRIQHVVIKPFMADTLLSALAPLADDYKTEREQKESLKQLRIEVSNSCERKQSGWSQRQQVASYHAKLPEIVAALQRDSSLACLFVDLSHLRRIEIEFGVAQHTELFTTAGRILESLRGGSLRDSDLLCRTEDADAYVCFLGPRRYPNGPPANLEQIAERIQEDLQRELLKELGQFTKQTPHVVVGNSRVINNPMVRPERLVVRLVTEARQSAGLLRDRGSNRDKGMLQEIILHEQLTPVYQPIVQLESADVSGYEALIRGPRDSRMETPMALFSTADAVDLTFELDRACFHAALRSAVGLEPIHRLFVNLLPMSFYDSSFIEREVTQLLDKAALTPANVVFEISERLAIDNFSSFRAALGSYTAMGFGVAIDDVGTRHSNLETVMALRPHFIKISDVLTRGVSTSPIKREMLSSLQRIAEAIDAVVVAEGIENEEDLEVLRELGVRYGQGYYLARPGPPFPALRPTIRRAVMGSQRRFRRNKPRTTNDLGRNDGYGLASGSMPVADVGDAVAELERSESTKPRIVMNDNDWQKIRTDDLGPTPTKTPTNEDSLLKSLRTGAANDPNANRDTLESGDGSSKPS